MIPPCNFSVCDTLTWVLDIGSPYHICNSLQDLRVNERFKEGERFLNVGDGSAVPVLALGTMELAFESHTIILYNCYFCLSFIMNVISVGLLALCSYELAIKGNYILIIMNGVNVVNGQLNNGVYVLSQPCIMNTLGKGPRFQDVSDAYL